MAIKIAKKPAPVADVTKTEGTKKGEEEVITNQKTVKETLSTSPGAGQVVQQEKPWCNVGVGAGYTHNLGNFQFVKIDVRLNVPCEHTEINEVYDFAKSWVDERLNKEVEELQSGGE